MSLKLHVHTKHGGLVFLVITAEHQSCMFLSYVCFKSLLLDAETQPSYQMSVISSPTCLKASSKSPDFVCFDVAITTCESNIKRVGYIFSDLSHHVLGVSQI